MPGPGGKTKEKTKSAARAAPPHGAAAGRCEKPKAPQTETVCGAFGCTVRIGRRVRAPLSGPFPSASGPFSKQLF